MGLLSCSVTNSFLVKCETKGKIDKDYFFKVRLATQNHERYTGRFWCSLFFSRYPDGSRTRVAGIEIHLSTTLPPWLPFLNLILYLRQKHLWNLQDWNINWKNVFATKDLFALFWTLCLNFQYSISSKIMDRVISSSWGRSCFDLPSARESKHTYWRHNWERS